MTRRAATYLRVSSDDQRERQTIETQQAAINDYLQRNPDFEIVATFRDDGVSGSIPLGGRPGGKRLLQGATGGDFDVLLVTRADRLGRDAIDLMQTRALLVSLHIELVGIQEPMDDEMGFDLRAVWAKHEKKRFLQRSAEGTARHASLGHYLGGICPLGYRVDGKRPDVRLVPSDAVMWADMTESDVVRRIYHLVGVEGWSTRRAAEELNNLGIPTAYQKDGRAVRTKATQGVWRPGRIGNLLRNPVYKGQLHYGKRAPKKKGEDQAAYERRMAVRVKTEIIVAPVPALVSVELWEAAQQTLARNRVIPTTARRAYLLRSVVKCGLCGLHYCGTKGRDSAWYRCNGQLVGRGVLEGKCWGRSLKCDVIDDLVWSDIEGWLLNPGNILDELAAELDQPEPDSSRVSAATLQTRLADLARQRANAVGLAVRGVLSDSDVRSELERVDGERTEIEARLAALVAQQRESVPQPDLALLDAVRARVPSLTFEEKHQIVKSLVKAVTVHTSRNDAGKKELRVVIEYQFPEPQNAASGVVLTDTGTGSWRR